MIFLEESLNQSRGVEFSGEVTGSQGEETQVIGYELIFVGEGDIAGERSDGREGFDGVVGLVDGLLEGALGFELLGLCEDEQVVGSQLF